MRWLRLERLAWDLCSLVSLVFLMLTVKLDLSSWLAVGFAMCTLVSAEFVGLLREHGRHSNGKCRAEADRG